MKRRIICLLLALFTVCLALLGCIQLNEDWIMKTLYLRQFEIEGKSAEDVLLEYDGGIYNGARIVMLDAGKHEAGTFTYKLSEYVIITYYDTNTLLAYKYGRFFNLKEALEAKILTVEDVGWISYNFFKADNCYIKICDKYDFEDAPECEKKIGTNHIEDTSAACYRNVKVKIDESIFLYLSPPTVQEDLQMVVDYMNAYLGKDIVLEISGKRNTVNGVYYTIHLNGNNYNSLTEAMELIATIPWIRGIGCNCAN